MKSGMEADENSGVTFGPALALSPASGILLSYIFLSSGK